MDEYGDAADQTVDFLYKTMCMLNWNSVKMYFK